MANVKALVDSGAQNGMTNGDWVVQAWATMENKLGKITHLVTLNVTTHGRQKQMEFLVTDIGNEVLLLAYPSLAT